MSHKLPTIAVRVLFRDFDGTGAPERDGWELRREFLDLRTDDDFYGFLSRTGKFQGGRLRSIADLREWQRIVHVLSRTPQQQWRKGERWRKGKYVIPVLVSKWNLDGLKFEKAADHALTVHPGEKDGAPAEVVSTTTIGAILDTVYVEKMEGQRIRCCALGGCLQTFPASRGREYCCDKHQSVASTRRSRENAKKRRTEAERMARKLKRQLVHKSSRSAAA